MRYGSLRACLVAAWAIAQGRSSRFMAFNLLAGGVSAIRSSSEPGGAVVVGDDACDGGVDPCDRGLGEQRAQGVAAQHVFLQQQPQQTAGRPPHT